MTPVSAVHFIECAANTALEWKRAQVDSVQFSHGMLSACEWTGVHLRAVLDEAGLRGGAKWLLAESGDAAAYARSIPLEKALDDAIIAYAQNGEALRPEQGYPLRLVVPGWEGSTNIKWLRRLKIGDRPWHTREETARYSDLLENGQSWQFTFVQEAKSIITSPCPEAPLLKKGEKVISGLAWSGQGRVSKVDISVDGGRTWRESRLQEPVLPKALTRFSMPWVWQGQEALLQSRVQDETGYVQPTIRQLRKARGDGSIYHNNMIMTWHVKASGEVQNVQVD
jgi:sulfane dehydrogenase subunit SoxC